MGFRKAIFGIDRDEETETKKKNKKFVVREFLSSEWERKREFHGHVVSCFPTFRHRPDPKST